MPEETEAEYRVYALEQDALWISERVASFAHVIEPDDLRRIAAALTSTADIADIYRTARAA